MEQRTAERVCDTVRQLVTVTDTVAERVTICDTIRETTTIQLNAEGDTTRRETEREHIKTRQREGIDAAKARGVRFGRPEKPIPADFSQIVKSWERRQIAFPEVLKRCDMSKATFYRRLREYQLTHQS